MIIDAHATDTVPSHEVRRRAQQALTNAGEPMSFACSRSDDMTEEQLVRAQREYERIHALLQGAVYGSMAVIAFGALVWAVLP